MALNIALSGVPGAGKSTIARRLAGEIGAVHIEIDLIDAAIRRNLGALEERDRYRAAYGVARALPPLRHWSSPDGRRRHRVAIIRHHGALAQLHI